ncbi:MAG: head GIN domain-containing protein [Caldimonas sp.]
MNDRRLAIATCLAVLTAPSWAADRAVRGSGRIATERRSVGGFERVAIAGAFAVELRQGQTEGVELSGDDNLLALVETRVEGAAGARTLKISPKPDIDLAPTQPIRIRVDLVGLGAIGLAGASTLTAGGLRVGRLDVTASGSASLALTGLEAERLVLKLGGSGRLSGDGRATAAALSIAGSGQVALARFAVDDLSIEIAGSGLAEVQANRRLSIAIAGSGRVRHLGAAVPSVSIVGSGSVQRG